MTYVLTSVTVIIIKSDLGPFSIQKRLASNLAAIYLTMAVSNQKAFATLAPLTYKFCFFTTVYFLTFFYYLTRKMYLNSLYSVNKRIEVLHGRKKNLLFLPCNMVAEQNL